MASYSNNNTTAENPQEFLLTTGSLTGVKTIYQVPAGMSAAGITQSAANRERISNFDSPTTPPSVIPGFAAVMVVTPRYRSASQAIHLATGA